MNSEQQYMDIFTGCREMLDSHSAGAMNALRDKAFEDFTRQGFPTQKVERYKYTDVPAAFAPDYGLNLNRVEFPVNPYEAFRCDVPNLSTSLYFVVNDAFYRKSLPAAALPEGVVVCSLKQAAEDYPDRGRRKATAPARFLPIRPIRGGWPSGPRRNAGCSPPATYVPPPRHAARK